MITALVLHLAVAQLYPFNRAREAQRLHGAREANNYAFFEAFPASGAGTTAACSTTAPTGARGEVLTFARASTGTCTKTAAGGLATTGIANGDLTSLGNNVARVEYDSAGTLGLLVEAARTNSLLRSQEIDNAAWTKYGFGSGSAPTVTADYATAPDGTMTADRVQFTAVNAGDQSGVLQASGITTGSNTVSLYVKGTSGSGSICIAAYLSGGSFATCNYVSTSWTRCTHTGTVTSAGQLRFGNDSASCGGGAMTAQDVLVWGAQWEAGAYATSYIPTVVATATRAVDSAAFTGLSISSAAGLSWSANVQHPSANAGSVWGASAGLVQDATNRTQLYRANTNVQTCDYLSTAGNRSAGGVIAVYVAGQLYRQACSYSGPGASSVLTSYRDGVSTGASAAGTTGAITITSLIPCALGTAATTAPADGICSRIKADPSALGGL